MPQYIQSLPTDQDNSMVTETHSDQQQRALSRTIYASFFPSFPLAPSEILLVAVGYCPNVPLSRLGEFPCLQSIFHHHLQSPRTSKLRVYEYLTLPPLSSRASCVLVHGTSCATSGEAYFIAVITATSTTTKVLLRGGLWKCRILAT